MCVWKSNNNSDSIDPQEGSASSGNNADISITYHDEVPPTPGNSGTPVSGDDENTPSPDSMAAEAQATGSEQRAATRMRTQANAAFSIVSHEGLKAH